MFFCCFQAAGGYSRTLPTWTSLPSARSLGLRVTRLDKLMDIWVKKISLEFLSGMHGAAHFAYPLSFLVRTINKNLVMPLAEFQIAFSPSRVVNQRPFRYLKYCMSTA